MRITLLGVYGPYPVADGGCSSYLVEDGDTRVLLDCGSGAMSRMLSRVPLSSLDAIVLSHLHADHAGEIDLIRYALEQGQGETPLRVFAPETERVSAPVFDPVLTADGTEARIGSLRLTFTAVRHAVKTVGVRVTDANGHVLFYTGDSGWFDGLCDAAKDADLLLADACLLDESNLKALQNHMTVDQVIRLKAAANCRRAVLTHLWGGVDAYPALALPDGCELAREGAVYDL